MTALPDEDLALCPTCGTQYDTPLDSPPDDCKICEDPRQFVPPTGQKWTSLRQEQGKHKNEWKQDEHDSRIWSIYTDPKLGIGERAILIQTEHGNILWDCFAYLGQECIDFINALGGLHAIVISHPHFYTTHLVWAQVFRCKVYTHAADASFLCRADHDTTHRVLIPADTDTTPIVPSATAVRIGGHFPGQLVLHFDGHVFHADGFVNVPSGGTPGANRARTQRREIVGVEKGMGMSTYAFMWSIPNMIPLGPEEMMAIWKALRGFEWTATHGLFVGFDVRGQDVKGRLLESMQNQVRRMGWTEHAILRERVA